MPPKQRNKENTKLPTAWRYKHNAYYYRVPKSVRHLWDNKTEFKLGKTLSEAHRTWAKKMETPKDANTIAQLLDQYDLLVITTKALKTQENNRLSIRRLRPVFGHMQIHELKPTHAFKFRDIVAAKHGKKSANHDLEVLSHVYSKAIEWGLIEEHPIKGKVPKLSVPARDRYVEDWEVVEALKVASPVIIAYIWIKLMSGQRRKDILSLTVHDVTGKEGIRIKPSKTSGSSGRKITLLWTSELLDWKDYILSIRPETSEPKLFVGRNGEPYLKEDGRANGFDSLWQRFIARALQKTELKERFQERDLRPKTASDTNLQHASRLLVHTSEEITKVVYRRKGDSVAPHSVYHLIQKPKS